MDKKREEDNDTSQSSVHYTSFPFSVKSKQAPPKKLLKLLTFQFVHIVTTDTRFIFLTFGIDQARPGR